MYFNCGWPARRARVSQVNQPVGEISCASRNRVSRDLSWTLPRASLLSYPAAAPVPFSLDTRHLIKKQNDSRASPRSTLLAFQTIIPETATGVRVSESLPSEWRRVAVVEEGNEEGILRIARIYYSSTCFGFRGCFWSEKFYYKGKQSCSFGVFGSRFRSLSRFPFVVFFARCNLIFFSSRDDISKEW